MIQCQADGEQVRGQLVPVKDFRDLERLLPEILTAGPVLSLHKRGHQNHYANLSRYEGLNQH